MVIGDELTASALMSSLRASTALRAAVSVLYCCTVPMMLFRCTVLLPADSRHLKTHTSGPLLLFSVVKDPFWYLSRLSVRVGVLTLFMSPFLSWLGGTTCIRRIQIRT